MGVSERDRLLDWLLVNGGPVVRYRTAHELCADLPALELKRFERELLALPLVQQGLARLDLGDFHGRLGQMNDARSARLGAMVHGSKPTSLENVLGRLNELGLRSGIPGLDQRMLPLMQIFGWQDNRPAMLRGQTSWATLLKSIFAWGLLRADYPPDSAMQNDLVEMVERVYPAARDQFFEIYAPPEELKGLPRHPEGKAVLSQAAIFDYHLPTTHDIYVLANLPKWMMDEVMAQKVDAVIRYILDPRFQSLHPSYGYAWIKERRSYYNWSHSPHLAGFESLDWQLEADAGRLVQQMEWMAHFPAARESRWFQAGLRHLEWHRTESGTYLFPAHYLREMPSGYYVDGCYMSLGENRRLRRGLEIESTFRMAKIRAVAGGCDERILL